LMVVLPPCLFLVVPEADHSSPSSAEVKQWVDL